ncbi:hypothetical protein GIB67_033009, partial [Kingdonia uniflora]
VQLSDATTHLTRSPIRHYPKRVISKPNGEGLAGDVAQSNPEEELKCQSLAGEASGSFESWMAVSTSGDKPMPRFNHAATVVGDKMVVVGGDSGHGLLDDVQVLNFEKFAWKSSSSKLYLSPTSLPLKLPACKGHSLVSWGKKTLLIGGKTVAGNDKVSVWAFDTETECWSHIEAKGEIPVARSYHTVVRAGSVLILFGGEDAKGRKLNDLHMFDLKSLMWLPLHCTGTGPSPRSNHIATLYDDKVLYIFGGKSKSRTQNDLHSLDFETMIWSRIKIKGFHPSPRAGCCGVLCGYKWYIAGGGSRKKRHAETLVFDVVRVKWSVAVASPPTSILANKGFSLVLVEQKDKVFLVAFGGYRKESSNEVEVMSMGMNEHSMGRRSTLDKGQCTLLFDNSSTARPCPIDSAARNNLASALEHHGSSRRSTSKFFVDTNLHKQFHEKEYDDNSPPKSYSTQTMEERSTPQDTGLETGVTKVLNNEEELTGVHDSKNSKLHQKKVEEAILSEIDERSLGIHQLYEPKLSDIVKENKVLEGQVAAALANKESAERNLSSVIKSRIDMEKKLADTVKEMELLKEKLVSVDLAQEEANSLSNVVHSDNVRLEHDVAFLKAVLDDMQKELHSTRGVLAGERARAIQLQMEVFHLKQRMQSMENRAASTPRKPF